VDTGAFLQEFLQQLQQTSYPEIIAVLFGVVSVLLASVNHVALYPTGIISTAIFIYLMGSAGLYAEASLNAYYLIMSIYGWLQWNKNHESENPAAISHNTPQDWMITALITGAGWMTLYAVLVKFTNSTVPAWDAVVSATAWAGMWLLAKHKIENWVLLNISNLISIPLLFAKGLAVTSLLTVFLFLVAVLGYFNWRNMYRKQHAQV